MSLSLLLSAQALNIRYQQMKPALIMMVAILAVLVASCIVFPQISARVKTSRGTRKTHNMILSLMYLTTVLVCICTLFCFIRFRQVTRQLAAADSQQNTSTADTTLTNDDTTATGETPTEGTTVPEETQPEPTYTPAHTDSSHPETW